MSVFQEFKKFALRGNVIDMAVGILIGGAFTSVVRSLVDDVIMPPIGIVTSGVDFKKLSYMLRDAPNDAQDVAIKYGNFITNVVTFLIVAWAAFMLVKAINIADEKLRFGEQPPQATPPPPEDVLLLREIRDALKRA
jgi:large conductance mechanosensitive channel